MYNPVNIKIPRKIARVTRVEYAAVKILRTMGCYKVYGLK